MARFRLTRIIAWSIGLLGISVAVCGLVNQLIFVLIALFIAGLNLAPFNTALNTLMQIMVPDEKLGRVSRVVDTAITLSYLISVSGTALLTDAFWHACCLRRCWNQYSLFYSAGPYSDEGIGVALRTGIVC